MRNTVKSFFCCLLLLTAGLYALPGGPLSAASPSIVVSAVRGMAEVIRKTGVTTSLQNGDQLQPGDLLVTGKGARLRILFADQTIVSVGENSRVELNDYLWSESTASGHFDITVNEGFFRIIGGKLTKVNPQAFRTRSPAATIGIRGSAFAGRVAGGGLEIFLLSGKGVDVGNRQGSVPLLLPGMGTTVASSTEKPATPLPMRQAEMQRILAGSAVDRDQVEFIPRPVPGGLEGEMQSGASSSRGGSTVSGTLINQSTISNSVNLSSGTGNRSAVGSVTAE